MKYSAGTGYRYGFNGKEKSSEITTDDYDFGARIYDGRIGRWLSLDPLQERYPGISPYNYCYNSPLNVIDPDGRLGIHVTVQYNSATKTYTILSITVDDDLKAVAPIPGKGNIGMDYHNYAKITFVDGNGKVTHTQNKTLSFRTNNWVAGKWWAKKKVDDGEYEDYGGVAWTSEDGGNEETRKGRPSHSSNIDLLMAAISGTKDIAGHGSFEFDGLEFLEKLTKIIEEISGSEPGTFNPTEDPSIKKDLDALKKMLSEYQEVGPGNSPTNTKPTVQNSSTSKPPPVKLYFKSPGEKKNKSAANEEGPGRKIRVMPVEGTKPDTIWYDKPKSF